MPPDYDVAAAEAALDPALHGQFSWLVCVESSNRLLAMAQALAQPCSWPPLALCTMLAGRPDVPPSRFDHQSNVSVVCRLV